MGIVWAGRYEYGKECNVGRRYLKGENKGNVSYVVRAQNLLGANKLLNKILPNQIKIF